VADTGWVTVGTGVDDSSYGSLTWGNPGNITADDGSFAGVGNRSITHYLKGTNVGLSIPAGATIDGIEIQFEMKTAPTFKGKLNRVSLVDETGTVGTTNRSDGQVFTTSYVFYPYGGASDLWEDTWDEAAVEDIDFGFVVATAEEAFGHTENCDVFQVKVYYTEGAVGTSFPPWKIPITHLLAR
jgi:hypothetical protein